MQISDIGTAARNLADYIDRWGESADVTVITAQIGLIAGHVIELEDESGDRS